MKFVEIEKEFTGIVNRYLSEGWELNLSTMGGSQGEMGKVDLKKDGHLIRIRLESHYHIGEEVYQVIVGKCVDDWVLSNVGKPTSHAIIWNDKLVVLEEKEWVRINNRKDWFVSREENKKMVEKKKERFYSSCKSDIVWKSESDDVKKIAYHIVRKRNGYKGVKKSEIEGVYHRDYYGRSVIEARVYRENKGFCDSVVLN